MTDIRATGRRAAVLGSPIDHSLSPVLHRRAYEALGLAGWEYGQQEVTAPELEGFLRGLDDSWVGLSLTMPLKQIVMKLVDQVEPLADVVGAVNTVLFGPGGFTVGANTDVYGIAQAITEARTGLTEQPRRGVIIGGGATAASAIAALGQLGITDPIILVRSLGRSGTVIRAATQMGVLAEYLTLGTPEATTAIRRADILVSTVPAGAADEYVADLPEVLRPEQTVLDVVYEGWPTPLPRAWRERGGTVAPGHEMLLHQATEQVRLMTGREAPVAEMRQALYQALQVE